MHAIALGDLPMLCHFALEALGFSLFMPIVYQLQFSFGLGSNGYRSVWPISVVIPAPTAPALTHPGYVT